MLEIVHLPRIDRLVSQISCRSIEQIVESTKLSATLRYFQRYQVELRIWQDSGSASIESIAFQERIETANKYAPEIIFK